MGVRRGATPADGGLFPPSLVELTTRRLRDEILGGTLRSGDRLIEEQICQRFSISRAPVREAMRLLAQQGLVEHVPRRGASVAVWSDTDVAQLFEIRAVLERYAISSALPLPSRPGADPLRRVRQRLQEMAEAQRAGDELAKDDAHRAFHAEIVALAGNRQLDLALEPILLKLQRPMAVNLRFEASTLGPDEGLRRHAALITALETNDPDAVLEALREHGGQRYLAMRQLAAGVEPGRSPAPAAT